MTQDERGEALARILDARSGRSAELTSAELHETSEEVRELALATDVLWASAQEVPPLENDSMALMLGLVPDPEFALDSKALSSARKRAGLSVGDLAQRLSARGWTVSGPDVFRWENKSALDVPPAMIRAAADELGVEASMLGRRESDDPVRARLRSMFSSEGFKELSARWARVQHVSLGMATTMMESRALAAVHRGGEPDPDVMLRALEALVVAVEQGESPEK